MTAKEKMHNTELYLPSDRELLKEQQKCLDKLYDFNRIRPSEYEKRAALQKEMFAEVGEDCYIESPLHANWGGRHVHLGKNVSQCNHITMRFACNDVRARFVARSYHTTVCSQPCFARNTNGVLMQNL